MPHDIHKNKKHKKTETTSSKKTPTSFRTKNKPLILNDNVLSEEDLNLKLDQLLEERDTANNLCIKAEQDHSTLKHQLIDLTFHYDNECANLKQEIEKLNFEYTRKVCKIERVTFKNTNAEEKTKKTNLFLEKINKVLNLNIKINKIKTKKDTEITKLNNALTIKNSEIEKFKKQFQDQNKQIQALQEKLREQTLTKLEEDLKKKSAKIEELQKSLQEKTEEIERIQKNVKQIMVDESTSDQNKAEYWRTQYENLAARVVPFSPPPPHFFANVMPLPIQPQHIAIAMNKRKNDVLQPQPLIIRPFQHSVAPRVEQPSAPLKP